MAANPSGLVPREGLVTLTHLMYGLHAFSALTGILTPALVVTAFLTGWPSIIAVIINYVKRSEVRETWLDSHFSWQLRTFWYALLWLALGGVLFVTVLRLVQVGAHTIRVERHRAQRERPDLSI